VKDCLTIVSAGATGFVYEYSPATSSASIAGQTEQCFSACINVCHAAGLVGYSPRSGYGTGAYKWDLGNDANNATRDILVLKQDHWLVGKLTEVSWLISIVR
jgi:hypothetical protein